MTTTHQRHYGATRTSRGGSPSVDILDIYDDTKGDPSAPGAFLIQNSFGTDWPPSEPNPDGRIWRAYRTFFESQDLAAVAYPRAVPAPLQGSRLESTLVRPEGFVTGVHHWVQPGDTSNVYLIVELQFTEPVQLESIVMTEPTTGTQVQQDYGLPFPTGSCSRAGSMAHSS